MIDWGVFLIPAAILLVIPVAIVPAFARPSGSIILSAALAVAAFAVFWLALGGINLYGLGGVNLIVLAVGLLATVVTWALSLNAAQTRRWLWVALLVVAGYLTFLAVFISIDTFQPCSTFDVYSCPPENPVKHALIIAGYLACAVVAFVYGVRPSLRRERKPPEGLVVSSLHAAPAADGDNLTGGA